MERRWNLAALMSLALLFLASTTAAADTNPIAEEQETGTVGKFCYSYTKSNGLLDEYVYLAQQPSSYVPNPPPPDDENNTEYYEYCHDTWLDFTASWEEFLQELGRPPTLYLETDLDFGGLNSKGTACNEKFKPLPTLSSYDRFTFYGEHHTIKNLCFIADSVSSEYIADGMGFFASLATVSVQNVNFENVYIEMKDKRVNDGVPTGALAGRLEGNGTSEISNITMKNVKIVASQAGGLVGIVTSEEPIFRDIAGESVEIFADVGTLVDSVETGNEYGLGVYLGGVIGKAEAGISISNVGITDLKIHSAEEGPLYLLEEAPDEGQEPAVVGSEDISQAMGGIVGIADGTSSNGYVVAIVNTYTVGDISAPSDCYSGENGECRIGFVGGEIKLNQSYFIGSNYHYGESDYMAEGAVGYLEVAFDHTTPWYQQNIGQGSRNFRNTVSGMQSPSQAQFDTTDYTWSGSVYGGDIPGELMKKDAFAFALTTQADGRYSALAWSRKNGVNNGLPVFASSTLRPIYQITFFANEDMFSGLSVGTQKKWEDADADISADGASLSVMTDYTGKLSNSTWQQAAAQIASEGYYWRYSESDGWNTTEKGFAIKSSTIFRSSMAFFLSEKFRIPVVHGVWNGDETSQGYAETIDKSEVVPVDKVTGLDYYYLGTPFDEVTADTSWAFLPWLAIGMGDDGYRYYQPLLYIKRCSGGECSDLMRYTRSDAGAVLRYYNDAVIEMSSEDTLYVVYDRSKNQSGLDGGLFVADLHGASFGDGEVYFDIGGLHGGEVSAFYHDNLTIQSYPTDSLAGIVRTLSSEGGAWPFNPTYLAEVPFAPYVVADYPSNFWGSVDGMVGLVVVGSNLGSASSAANLLGRALDTLVNMDFDHPLLKDTLASLESSEDIYNYMVDHLSDAVSYARFVDMGENRSIDLTNLIAVVRSFRFYTGDLPIFVGFMPRVHEIKYHLSFDVESNYYASYGDNSPLFVGHTWVDKKGIPDATYTQENSGGEFVNTNEWGLVRTDACYRGAWSIRPSESRGEDEPSIYSFHVLQYPEEFEILDEIPFVENKDGSKSLKLYAYWETEPEYCLEGWPTRVEWNEEIGAQVWSNAIIEDKSERGNVVLQQVWNGDTLRHKSTSLDEQVTGIYVPRADSLIYTFEVFAEGIPGYELDGDITFSKKASWDDVATSVKLKEGDTLRLGGYELSDYTMSFSADYTYKRYNIVFVSGKNGTLYGENSDSVGTYRVKSKSDAIDLPKWVYTEDNCVDGWMWHPESADKDPYLADFAGDGVRPVQEENVHDNWTTVFDEFNFALSEELDNQLGNRLKEYPLYAVWVDAKTCVKDLGYKQARLNIAENGLVKFKELVRDSDGKVLRTQVHQFAKDSTMLLPSYVDGANFVVLGAPAKGYILDSLVMILNGDTSVYHEGDTLTGDIALATFEAYFMLDNTTPAEFVKAELLQSGSAIRFEFVTSEFGVSGASVKIVLEDDDGKAVADTVLAVPATPYADSWEYFPLRAGTYLLTATVKNSKSSDVFEKDFEVKSTIASKKDGWQMLSLSNVIMDSVTWDDDVRFFWWDDARDYGAYWRYQRLTKKDKVDDLTGYWYSSLEGRPLVMRKDMKPPKSPVVWGLDSVYTGWNLVANPYGWYVDLYGENQEQKKSSIEKSDIEFWSWNDSLSAYEEVDVVGPYEAVWAKVKAPGKWKLPSKPDFVATVDENGNDSLTKPLKKTVELASNRKGNWAIRAVLRDAKGKRDGWNIMGVSESGWSAEEPPAGMGDHVNLSIKDGNRSLAKSFKAASGDSYEWTVSLDASGNRTGYLHFEGLEAVREAGLKVFVTVDGATTQMAENDTLKVAIGSMAKTATVRVAPSARTIVAQKLNGLRAFQSGNALQVGFQVSESLEGAKAYVEILDMKGKVLSSVSGTAVSGSNSMTLQAPKSGLYMIRVRVGSKQAAGSIAVK